VYLHYHHHVHHRRVHQHLHQHQDTNLLNPLLRLIAAAPVAIATDVDVDEIAAVVIFPVLVHS